MPVALAFETASAQQKPVVPLKPIPTAKEIKKIDFPYKPVKVVAQAESGTTESAPSGYTSCEKYATGAGVLLTPANLIDTESVSTLALYFAEYNYTAASQMSNAAEPFASLRIPPLKAYPAHIASVVFGRMPRETRTYVLTLKMDKITQGGYFEINVNGTQFQGDKILYNDLNKEYRILFSFAPVTSQMNILVYYYNQNQSVDAKISFYYAQLIRLD